MEKRRPQLLKEWQLKPALFSLPRKSSNVAELLHQAPVDIVVKELKQVGAAGGKGEDIDSMSIAELPEV
jgi:hypothetical protein